MSEQQRRMLINDRYELVSLLGKGTTGMVYLARDVELNRNAAIKIVHEKLVDNQAVIDRFEREIFLTARLQHPGVAAVFERGYSLEGFPCYMMSPAIGETLEEYLQGLAKVDDHWHKATLIDRLTLFLKIVDVMCYAHSMGVVHRDLKPANIVLGEYGEVHILDWGLARTLDVEPIQQTAEAFDDVFGEVDASEKSVGTTEQRQAGITTASTGITTREDEYHPLSVIESERLEQNSETALGYAPTIVPGVSVEAPLTDRASGQDTTSVGSLAPQNRPTSDYHNKSSGNHRRRTTQSYRRSTSGYIRTNSVSGRRSSLDGVHTEGHAFSSRSTRHGDVLGSPVYMSPEQASGNADQADERADIYALGVILVELLALRAPMEQEPGETLIQFIDRICNNINRKTLRELWPDSPVSLQRITDWALAHSVESRYPTCDVFKAELSQVLGQLSESFSEMERQRLAREREGAWLPVGRWNYALKEDVEPLSEAVVAYEGEPVGQILHPEMGGVLIGGTGMQVYPLSVAGITDDVRMTLDFSITGGSECWIFMRGTPPSSSYVFRIGAWGGKWLSISQVTGMDDLLQPSSLTMRPVGMHGQTTMFRTRTHVDRSHLVIEVVGSSLSIRFNEQEQLSYQDPIPLLGPEHYQMAIATKDSQVVLHEMMIESRRSPLMVPSYAIANELLRQKLYPQAITYFRRFVTEHVDSEEKPDAHFMLCLAFRRAGYKEQAEEELHSFLLEHMDHALAQDAIIELAMLKTGGSANIGPGVRAVLSYQAAEDRSRSRFCLWAVQVLKEAIIEEGITADVEESLQMLKHLIRGFSDENLLQNTVSYILSQPIKEFATKLFDLQAYDEMYTFQRRVEHCQKIGYSVVMPVLHTPVQYVEASRMLTSFTIGDTLDLSMIEDTLKQFSSIRDMISLSALGCTKLILNYLRRLDNARPSIQLLQAGLFSRIGDVSAAELQLQHCFTLMDKIESERTDTEIATVSRLSMFALGFMPWSVAWEPLTILDTSPDLQALAAWIAESFGYTHEAVEGYRHLYSSLGSGFRGIAEQGMARLGMMEESEMSNPTLS